MPSSKNYQRNYAEEAATESTARKKQRTMRVAARRAYEAANGSIPEGYDLDHRAPLSRGGSNSPSNWRVERSSKNRSYPRNKDGSIK